MTRAVLAGIKFYQAAISPWAPSVCRYTPSCSEYGRIAISTHGVWRGGILTLRRLLRCTPFRHGGYDPVP
jgi:putative membrane protein insertion efficiency factor